MLWSGTALSQVSVKHFNASWNEANGVDWIMDLKDRTKYFIYGDTDKECSQKYTLEKLLDAVFVFNIREEKIDGAKSILHRVFCNGEGSTYLSDFDLKMVQIHYDPRNLYKSSSSNKKRPSINTLYTQFGIDS